MKSELDSQACPLCGHQPITRNLVETRKKLDVIKKFVCRKYRITRVEIESSSRKAHIVKARNEAMRLCKQRTKATLEEIGKCFNRKHSTVLHAINNE